MDNTQQLIICGSQIWQLAVITLILIIIIPLATLLRRAIWIFGNFKNINNNNKIIQILKRCAIILSEKWGIVVLFEIFFTFIYIAVLFPIVLGSNYIMASLAFGAAIVIFLTFQLPRLLKPNVFISILPSKEGTYINMGELEKPQYELLLDAGIDYQLYVCLVNLGINNYENCGVWFGFDKKKKIIPIFNEEDIERIKGNPFIKVKHPIDDIIYHEHNNWVHFRPSGKFAFGPADVLMKQCHIQIPKESGKYDIKIEVNCSTRWGSAKKILCINVKQSIKE